MLTKLLKNLRPKAVAIIIQESSTTHLTMMSEINFLLTTIS